MLRPATIVALAVGAPVLLASIAVAQSGTTVSDDVLAAQRDALVASTKDRGYGPQSPRDLTVREGTNARVFQFAPPYQDMNLCNIHFHESAEHRGGEFTTYRGNGDGKGAGTGFVYDGELSDAEKAPLGRKIGDGPYGDLEPGDTIEAHYVYTTAQVTPGPTLGACLNEATMNPQLRVEAQVFVLVNDENADDFAKLAAVEEQDGRFRAVNKPYDTGEPITYGGSTTGPGYNEKGSPLKVTWSVRPKVLKVSIASVERWLADNPFDERAAHGVRSLVTVPELMSPIAN